LQVVVVVLPGTVVVVVLEDSGIRTTFLFLSAATRLLWAREV
jgi:hypothetical protein